MAEMEIGASRFGGDPDLPPHFGWPRRNGQPLDFLAQINLSEVNQLWPSESSIELHESGRIDLPANGWLLFFYDCEEMPWGGSTKDRGGAQVIWVDRPVVELGRSPVPLRSASRYGQLRTSPHRLNFELMLDLPDGSDELYQGEANFPDFRAIYGAQHKEKFEHYEELMHALYGHPHADEWYHHLVGHAQIVQNAMRDECQSLVFPIVGQTGLLLPDLQRQRVKECAPDWELLAQLDSDESKEGPQWLWGDVGKLYWWIRRQDLAARDFSNVWVVMQCL
jgi:uncharacterized protein YwqG